MRLSGDIAGLAPWRQAATHKPLPCSVRMDDGASFLHTHHSDHGETHAALLCLVEKVGSTTWKFLLLKAPAQPHGFLGRL